MRVDAEYHPNPEYATFYVDRPVFDGVYDSWRAPEKTTWEVKQIVNTLLGEEALREPVKHAVPGFIKAMFQINGVSEVGMSRYEIRVTKAKLFDWKDLESDIKAVIREYFDADKDVQNLIGDPS